MLLISDELDFSDPSSSSVLVERLLISLIKHLLYATSEGMSLEVYIDFLSIRKLNSLQLLDIFISYEILLLYSRVVSQILQTFDTLHKNTD